LGEGEKEKAEEKEKAARPCGSRSKLKEPSRRGSFLAGRQIVKPKKLRFPAFPLFSRELDAGWSRSKVGPWGSKVWTLWISLSAISRLAKGPNLVVGFFNP